MAVGKGERAGDYCILILSALSLLAAQAPATSAEPVYPLAEILDSALSACARSALPSANPASPVGKWEAFEPEAGNWTATQLSQFDNAGGLDVTAQAYRATIAGRELVAIVMTLSLAIAPEAPPTYSCEIFDRAAPPISRQAVGDWARRRAPRWLNLPGGGFLAQWRGLAAGNEESVVRFDVAGSDDSARRGLSYTATGTLRRRRTLSRNPSG
jgi:hypothetical protein